MINTYPLKWPLGWPRNQYPKRSNFKPDSPFEESQHINRELHLLKATNIVINSNMQYRNDGLPYARQNVQDTGVAVYFTLNGEQRCIPFDKWQTLSENLRAVWKTIEALRGIERWGAKEMVDAAFSGFRALPEGKNPSQSHWSNVLGVPPTANLGTITEAYRLLVMKHHPDRGGDVELFKRLNQAYDEAKREVTV